MPALLASRPFLEGHVRAAVGELPGVTLVPEHDIVCGLTATDDRRRSPGSAGPPGRRRSHPERLPADLVIDATGRGSRTPVWLAELGYPQPERGPGRDRPGLRHADLPAPPRAP